MTNIRVFVFEKFSLFLVLSDEDIDAFFIETINFEKEWGKFSLFNQKPLFRISGSCLNFYLVRFFSSPKSIYICLSVLLLKAYLIRKTFFYIFFFFVAYCMSHVGENYFVVKVLAFKSLFYILLQNLILIHNISLF